MIKYLQKLGKSLMLPVSVLPICGILMGLGYLMCPASMQGGEITGVIQIIGYFLVKAGSAIIDNISWLFAIGVAVGMSDDNDGSVAIAGLVSWLMIITLLSPDVIKSIRPSVEGNDLFLMAFEKIKNPFIAILSGIIGAYCYNHFRTVELPEYLSFFSRKRFVIIAAAGVSIVIAAILAFVWPTAFSGLTALGHAVASLGGIGAGIHAFLNRLLIPTGLHHALNNVFWFDTIGLGDLTNYWAGKTSADVGWSLGMYMSGFFPCTMFGIAGAALALYKTSNNKKAAKGILISSVVCAFISGVTEPFEFSFMFLSFPLYVVYSLLYGIFTVITYYSGFRAGFSFSSGTIDLLLSSSLPAAQRTWLIIPIGIAAFIVFYLVFKAICSRHKIELGADTAGESDDLSAPQMQANQADGQPSQAAGQPGKGSAKAEAMIQALGGRSNIEEVACCATRLRLVLKDTSPVDEAAVKKAGGIAYIKIDEKTCQVIIGTSVQKICDEMKAVLAEQPQTQPAKEEANPQPVKKEDSACNKKLMVSKNCTECIEITKTGQGIAAGPVFMVDRDEPESNEHKSVSLSPEEEWKRFEDAIVKTKEKLALAKGDLKDVLATYALFLDDETALAEAKKAVFENKKSAEEATVIAGAAGKEKLSQIDNDYIKSRVDDIVAAFDFLKKELEGGELAAVDTPSIIIGNALMPTDLNRVGEDNVLAIITAKGSQTSHLAIIAKGLGLPYVVSADPELAQLNNGDYIIIDTDEGRIIINPDEETKNSAVEIMEKQKAEREAEDTAYLGDIELPVKVYANIGSPEELDKVLKANADGIGLFRSEFLYLDRDSAPDEEEQFEAYKSVVEGMKGKPVIIRTSDIGTDKKPSYMDLPKEENPALGKRAIRLSLSDPETFRVQLRALLRAACYGDERIMYPMITSVKEIKLLNEQLQKAAEELKERNVEYRIPPCGIMIETPAAAMISDVLAKEVAFFSIGTNDLTQYTLALDRQGEGMEMFSDSRHEAVIRLIEVTAKNAKAAGIETGICGELGADETLIERFIKAGVDELSMSPAMIPRIKNRLAKYADSMSSETVQPQTDDTKSQNQDVADSLIAAPADGILIKMEDIPDEVFSSGALGQCFAVDPEDGNIYAPVSGSIVTVADTLHAISIKADNGQDVLVHAGIDTVKLGGKCFSTDIKVGDRVEKGQLILKADIDAIRAAGYSPMIITVLLDS